MFRLSAILNSSYWLTHHYADKAPYSECTVGTIGQATMGNVSNLSKNLVICML